MNNQSKPSPGPRKRVTVHQPANGYDCTLRMPRQEIDSIRHQLDAGTASTPAASQRQFRRWPFERVPVSVRMSHPGGMVTTLQYACRNLSNGGMSILHSAFVHQGTRCVVTLPHPVRGHVDLHGEVIRCRHCRGKVHEVGIKFDHSIDLSEVLNLDSSDNSLVLENIQPDKLVGSILIIDDSELDRVYMRKCLAETQLSVVAVATGAEGLERSKNELDLIICDYDLPDMNGLEVVRRLREAQNHTPVIMVSADMNLRDKLPGAEVGPDSVVPKPFKPQRLLGAIAQFVLADGAGGNNGGLMYSSLDPTDTAYSLLSTFIAEVRKLSKELSLAMLRDDSSAARRIAFQLKGAAATFGYEALGRAAEKTYTALSASGSVGECRSALDGLLSACSRVREKQAA